MKIGTDQSGGVRGLVIFVAVILAAAVLWQLQSDQARKDASVVRELSYNSTQGEVSLNYPSNWTISPGSFEESGFYSLEFGGPRNQSINRQVQERYSLNIEQGFVTDDKFAEILQDPITNDYVIILIDIVSGAEFEISNHREQWRNDLIAENDVTSGVSYGSFTEIDINGSGGYLFTIQVEATESSTSAVGYYLLGQSAEVEVTIFPDDTNLLQEAEQIVESIIINDLTNSDET